MDNLKLWGAVDQTDPEYTKGYKGAGGFTGTSINAMYLIKKATEQFGPVGIGWGWSVLDERFDKGAPIAHFIDVNGEKKATLSDHCESVHTLKLELWYKLGDQVGKVVGYGQTAMVFSNKYGYQTETEPAKKSLTDAIKKCLSMIGFSADIFLGEYDDPNYISQAQAEIQLKKADDREAEIEAQRNELLDYINRHLESLRTALSVHEVNGIARTSLRYLERRKAMQDMKALAEKGIAAIGREAEARKLSLEKPNETV
jgi:hypothetical protein